HPPRQIAIELYGSTPSWRGAFFWWGRLQPVNPNEARTHLLISDAGVVETPPAGSSHLHALLSAVGRTAAVGCRRRRKHFIPAGPRCRAPWPQPLRSRLAAWSNRHTN